LKWIAYRKVKKAGKYGKRNKAPTESGRVRGRDGTGGPATLSLGRLAKLGPLEPAPAHPGHSLRDGVTFRFCGGIGPLRPAPAHSS
jgi:hypothetical protein